MLWFLDCGFWIVLSRQFMSLFHSSCVFKKNVQLGDGVHKIDMIFSMSSHHQICASAVDHSSDSLTLASFLAN